LPTAPPSRGGCGHHDVLSRQDLARAPRCLLQHGVRVGPASLAQERVQAAKNDPTQVSAPAFAQEPVHARSGSRRRGGLATARSRRSSRRAASNRTGSAPRPGRRRRAAGLLSVPGNFVRSCARWALRSTLSDRALSARAKRTRDLQGLPDHRVDDAEDHHEVSAATRSGFPALSTQSRYSFRPQASTSSARSTCSV